MRPDRIPPAGELSRFFTSAALLELPRRWRAWGNSTGWVNRARGWSCVVSADALAGVCFAMVQMDELPRIRGLDLGAHEDLWIQPPLRVPGEAQRFQITASARGTEAELLPRSETPCDRTRSRANSRSPSTPHNRRHSTRPFPRELGGGSGSSGICLS